MATILTKKSDTASSVPLVADLTNAAGGAELAVNTADKRLFTKTSGGTVVELGINPSSLTLPNGTANSVPYLNGSKVLTTGSALQFDGANLGLGVTPSAWSGYKASAVIHTNLFGASGGTGGVSNNAYFDGSVWRYIASAQSTKFESGAGAYTWSTAPSGTAGNAISFTQAMTLDASARLGLSNTSPTQDVSVGIVTGTHGYNIVYTGTGTEVASFTANAGTGEIRFGATSTYFPTFYSNGSERARIDSSGNFLVGTASTPSGANNSGAFVPAGGQTVISTSRSSTTASSHLYFYNPNGLVGNINTSGSSTAYATSSDYRLKENIQPMTGALAKIAALKPVTYTWKADGSAGEGFIAHELAEVCPSAVTGEKDGMRTEQYEISPAVPATFDADGNELTPAVEAVMGERQVPAYQGIDVSFLVGTLTAAIQELKAEFDAYKAAHP